MSETPNDVYRQAADAMVGPGHMRAGTRKVLADGWVRRAEFRAAVDVVFAAGRGSWRREHPIPICDGGEVVMVTDVKLWMRDG